MHIDQRHGNYVMTQTGITIIILSIYIAPVGSKCFTENILLYFVVLTTTYHNPIGHFCYSHIAGGGEIKLKDGNLP